MKKQRIIEKLSTAYVKKTGHEIPECKLYKSGKSVFAFRERPKGVYYLCSGRVKILQEGGHGEEIVLRIAGPGDFIGFVSLIKRSGYKSSAIVVDKAEIQFIPKTIFLDLLMDDWDFAREVIEILCEKVKKAHDNVAGLMGMSGKQRLAALLLSLELAFDEDFNFKNSFIRIPKKDLAAAIGITPETISRYLSAFRKKGLVRTTDGAIEVLNRSALLGVSRIND